MASIAALMMILFVLIEVKCGFNPAIVGLIFLMIAAVILSLAESILRKEGPGAKELFRNLVLNTFDIFLLFIYISVLSILPQQDVLIQFSSFLIVLFFVTNAIPIIFDAIGRGRDPPDYLKRIFNELKEKMGIKANIRLKLFKSSLMKTALLGGLIRPTVFVNEDLLNELSDGELKSVLAHELAHYKGGDLIRYLGYSLLMYIALLLVGEAIPMMGLAQAREPITLLIFVIGFLAALSIFLILIRGRETKADLLAASYTSPEDLINALTKIYRIKKSPSFLPTHPSLEKRIEAIRRASCGRNEAVGDR